MSNLDKDDKRLVVLFIIFLILLSIYLIFYLLRNENKEKSEGTEVVSDYYLISNSGDYKLYTIKEDIFNNFDLTINNVKFSYKDNLLIINNSAFNNRVKLINNIAFYGDIIILFVNDIQNNKSYCLYYYINKGYYYILDQIDNMFIYNIEASETTEAGLILYLSYVYDNNLLIDGKKYSICNYKNNKTIISKSILLIYDIDKKSFNDYDTIDKKYINDIYKEYCRN